MAMLGMLQKRCIRSSNSGKFESCGSCSRGRVSPPFGAMQCGRSAVCGHSTTCCRWHLTPAAISWGPTSLFIVVLVVSAAAHVATDCSDRPFLHQVAAAVAHPPPDNDTTATAGDRQEEQTLSPRIVRVGVVGGGISSAAVATFLSILERQVYYERIAKQEMDEKRHSQEGSSSAPEKAVQSDEQDNEDSEGERKVEEQWWMNRPIQFQVDIYEASERFGGRMEYTDVAGRTIELGDAGASMSNLWMKVFHDLLNEYVDDLVGDPEWSTPEEGAAAAPAAAAAPDETAAAAAPVDETAGAAVTDETAAAAVAVTTGETTVAAAAGEKAAAVAAEDDKTATGEPTAVNSPEAAAAASPEAAAAAASPEAAAAAASPEAAAAAASPDAAATAASPDAAATAASPEAATTADVHSDAVSGPGTSGGDSFLHETASKESIDTKSPEGNQQEHADRDEGQQVEQEAKQKDEQPEAQPSHQDECCAQGSDAQLEKQEPGHNTDDVRHRQSDGPEGGAAETTVPTATGAAPPEANPDITGETKTFTPPPLLTEFEGTQPTTTILLHDKVRATTVENLPETLMKAGIATLIEPLGPIIRAWQRIYDFTFGGTKCARRAALSLFEGTEHYIVPKPSRRHRSGRPHCSVLKQAKAATRTGVGIAEAVGLQEEIRYPFSRVLKMYYIDWIGQRLIDGFLRGAYGQRSTSVHALAGTLGLLASYDTPYPSKRYSGQVLVEFLIARFADNSFLNCPIHKIIELEDEIVLPAQEDGGATALGAAADASVTDPSGDPTGAVGGASATGESHKQHASDSVRSADSAIKRRKRFQLEPGRGGVCSNDEAREHLENTIYDFVVIGTPLEGSSLTVYRRVPVREPERQGKKAAGQQLNVSNPKNEKPPTDDARSAFFKWFAAQHQNTKKKGEAESSGKSGEAQGSIGENSDQKQETANTNNLSREAPRGQPDAQNESPHEGELQQLKRGHQGQAEGNQSVRHIEKTQWTLEKVEAVRRPYVGVHVTCTAAEGLVRHRTDEDRTYEKKNITDYLDRPQPTTLLTSDSLSKKYYSFGELFVATCHDVAESELEEVVGPARRADKGKRPLILFFTRKEEDQKRRRNDANTDIEGEDNKRDTTGTTKQEGAAPPTAAPDDQSSVPAGKEGKVDNELLSDSSATNTEAQQSEAQSPTAKKLYYTGKALSPLAEAGFLSRIEELTTPSRQVGDTICCAVTERALSDTDLKDVFKNPSHTKRRSWHFARPKMHPILERDQELPFIWGLKEDPLPTVVPEVTNFVLVENVFYSSAFESIVSSTEGAILSAKNVANLIIKEVMKNYDD